MDEREKSKRAGRRVLFCFFLFFITVAAVNGVFIFYAVQTHTGVTVDNAYQRGLEYNKTLEQAGREDRLGWRAELEVVPQGGPGTHLTLKVFDRQGAPLDLSSLEAVMRRPVTEGKDFIPAFEKTGAGMYSARVDFPFPGQCELKAVLTKDKEMFHFVKRLYIDG